MKAKKEIHKFKIHISISKVLKYLHFVMNNNNNDNIDTTTYLFRKGLWVPMDIFFLAHRAFWQFVLSFKGNFFLFKKETKDESKLQ